MYNCESVIPDTLAGRTARPNEKEGVNGTSFVETKMSTAVSMQAHALIINLEFSLSQNYAFSLIQGCANASLAVYLLRGSFLNRHSMKSLASSLLSVQ
mmetsp:Transcript_9996/g.16075  ORF Transcript_9996/g.16075 Transcript_9996/m.16075 type:complete len:98 (+) Transcript_9996:224-517(+)